MRDRRPASLARSSRRAAIFAPSLIRSPSASSTMSPKWMPRRNSMRRSGRQADVALDHRVLHFECAAHRVDDAPKLDDAAITGALDDAAIMYGDHGIDQIATLRSGSRQSSIFVRASELAIAPHPRLESPQFSGFRSWRTDLCSAARRILPSGVRHARPSSSTRMRQERGRAFPVVNR
jgi:hypothetical protein